MHLLVFLFCVLQASTVLKELDLTWRAVQRELTVLTPATGLSLSAGSVTAAITALPEMAQLSLDHVRKDITAHLETPLRDLSRRLQVNNPLHQMCASRSHVQQGRSLPHCFLLTWENWIVCSKIICWNVEVFLFWDGWQTAAVLCVAHQEREGRVLVVITAPRPPSILCPVHVGHSPTGPH